MAQDSGTSVLGEQFLLSTPGTDGFHRLIVVPPEGLPLRKWGYWEIVLPEGGTRYQTLSGRSIWNYGSWIYVPTGGSGYLVRAVWNVAGLTWIATSGTSLNI